MTRQGQNEIDARVWIEHEIDHEWGESVYRGYKLLGVRWAHVGHGFSLNAFMPNSPLHPNDVMYASCTDVNNWREYFGPTGTNIAANTVLSLKRLIDIAHDNPDKFVATGLALPAMELAE